MQKVLGINKLNMQQKLLLCIEEAVEGRNESDQLWVWGKNDYGQLGLSHANYVTIPLFRSHTPSASNQTSSLHQTAQTPSFVAGFKPSSEPIEVKSTIARSRLNARKRRHSKRRKSFFLMSKKRLRRKYSVTRTSEGKRQRTTSNNLSLTKRTEIIIRNSRRKPNGSSHRQERPSSLNHSRTTSSISNVHSRTSSSPPNKRN